MSDPRALEGVPPKNYSYQTTLCKKQYVFGFNFEKFIPILLVGSPQSFKVWELVA